jgi:hypothetical protein
MGAYKTRLVWRLDGARCRWDSTGFFFEARCCDVRDDGPCIDAKACVT